VPNALLFSQKKLREPVTRDPIPISGPSVLEGNKYCQKIKERNNEKGEIQTNKGEAAQG